MVQKEHSNQLFIFNVVIFICFAISLSFLINIYESYLFTYISALLIINFIIYIIMNYTYQTNPKKLLNMTGFYTAWVFISPALIYYITQNSVA